MLSVVLICTRMHRSGIPVKRPTRQYPAVVTGVSRTAEQLLLGFACRLAARRCGRKPPKETQILILVEIT